MLVNTQELLHRCLDRLNDDHILTVVVDLETNGLEPYLGNRLIGIALYLPEVDESYYIPFRHGEGFNWSLDVLEKFYAPLSDEDRSYYGWNVKFDVHFLLVDGFPILENNVPYYDVMLALHMLDENRYDPMDERKLNYKLKDNGRLFLGVEQGEAEDELKDVLKERGLGKGDMWKLPADTVNEYAEQDVILTWRLFQFFLPYLETWNQVDLFYENATINTTILARMEHYGVPVDKEKIQAHIKENQEKSQNILASLRSHFGSHFNPNSPKQVSEAFGSDNAKKGTLEGLDNEWADLILEYKYLTKAEGTFYKPYLYYSAFDGRIHPTFHMGRTNSRRLSSSDPNLQQVPRYSSKYRVKEVFVAPNGYKLVQFDYAQQELRLACNFSGQENMIQLFLEDRDLHAYTAAYLFGVDEQWILENKDHDPKAKEMRHIGKTANFGFLYGMGKRKASVYLSENLKRDVSEREAGKILGAWRELFPKFVSKLQECSTVADTLRDGHKYFAIEDGTVRHYIKGQRPFTAWNFLIQGTGAYIMRQSLKRVHQAFPYWIEEVKPIISVHDSLVCLIAEDDLDSNIFTIKHYMEDFPQYHPPMKIDIQIGNNWGQLESWST